MASDYYDGYLEETKVKHQKMAPYLDLAEKQGDAVMMDKPWELRVILRKPKKDTTDESKNT